MNPDITLRPMLPADAAPLAAIFRAAVFVLAEDDYDEDQLEAWAGDAEDTTAFARRLGGQLTLVAQRDGRPVGFASLEGTDKVAMIYVDPDHARAGVATLLLDALVRLAGARGAAKLSVDASDTARDFFAARGFTPTMRSTVRRGEQWLGNTTMERRLTDASTPAAPPPSRLQ